jgi:hypothetical protein
MKQRYKGSCFIGIVGAYNSPRICNVTIGNIQRRDGDAIPLHMQATKGFEARQMILNKWMDETEHPFCLFLDADMYFEADTLERLRRHELPYVSGYYMRRKNPTYSVWFEPWHDAETGDVATYPPRPFFDVPARDKLYPLGGSGWGCVLVHRDVVTAMRKVLKGQMEIIEDAMTVWPYDLDKVLAGQEQLRPLTGQHKTLGSDVRFPFFAAAAGYQLLGDANVRPGHDFNVIISPDAYDEGTPEGIANTKRAWAAEFGDPLNEAYNKRMRKWHAFAL